MLLHPNVVPQSSDDFIVRTNHAIDYNKYDYTPISRSVLNKHRRKQMQQQRKKQRKDSAETTVPTKANASPCEKTLYPGVYLAKPK